MNYKLEISKLYFQEKKEEERKIKIELADSTLKVYDEVILYFYYELLSVE